MSGKILKYFFRFALGIVLLVLFAFIGIYIYFNTDSGRKYLSYLIVDQAKKTLGTEVKADISFKFPDWVVLENVFISDDHKDSLLASKRLYLDLDMWALKDSKLLLNKIELENTKLYVQKTKGKYNFDGILNHLNPPTKNEVKKEPWTLSLSQINSKNLEISIKNDDSEQYLDLQIGEFDSGFDVLNPGKNIYHVKNTKLVDIYVNGKIGKNNTAKDTDEKTIYDLGLANLKTHNLNTNIVFTDFRKKIIVEKADFETDIPTLSLDSISLEKSLLKAERIAALSTKNIKKRQDEFDPNYIDLSEIRIDLEKIKFSQNSLDGSALVCKLKEQTGFKNYLAISKFSLAKNRVTLDGLKGQLNESEIQGNAKIDLSIKNNISYSSQIRSVNVHISDALYFNRQLAKNLNFKKLVNDIIAFSGNLKGDLDQIFISSGKLNAPKESNVSFDGFVKNFKNPNFYFNINTLNSNSKDVLTWVDLKDYTLPPKFSLSGIVKGNLKNIETILDLRSSQGQANVISTVNLRQESYLANLTLNTYKVGELLNNKDIGGSSGNIKVTGQSFKNPVLKTESHLSKVEYQGKTYENIDALANIQDKIITADIAIKQADTDLKWQGKIDISQPKIIVEGKTQIGELNLKTLGITNQNIAIKGDLDIRQFEWDPASPLINLTGKNIEIKVDNKMYPLSAISIQTETKLDTKTIHVLTPFLNLDLKGAFSYATLAQAIQQEVHHYFKIPGFVPNYSAEKTDIQIDGNLTYDSLFTAFVPGLNYFQPIKIQTFINNKSDIPLGGKIIIPYLKYDSVNVRNSTLSFMGNSEQINYTFSSAEIQNNTYRIRNSAIEGKIQNDKADFSLSVKDEDGKKIHALKGYLNSIDEGVRVFFDESGTLLSYQEWAGNPYGSFEFTKAGIKFNDVVFTNGEQIMRVSSLNDVPNGPLAIFANNIDLNLLAKSFLRDSLLLAGKLDLDLETINYTTSEPAFTGDFSIENLVYKTYSLGQLQGKAESVGTEGIEMHADLNDKNQELSFDGIYKPKAAEPFDFKLIVKTFEAKTLGIWTEGILEDLKGSIGGQFTLKGSPETPKIEGYAEAQNMQMRLLETGALLHLNNQKFTIQDNKIKLDKVEVKDKEFNTLIVNGLVNITSLPDYSYNLKLKANDFKIIDAEEGRNPLFVGQGYVDTDIQITGKNLDFKCTGDVALKDKTNLTLLTEEEGKAQSEMDQLVTFIQRTDSSATSTKKIEEETKINFANSVNISLDIRKEAKIKILIDAITGDLMEANGTGKLNVGFDNQGDLFVIGRFGISSGKYNLTYQIIKREFVIDKNSESNITWNGNPLAGVLDITAFYQIPGKKNIPVQSSNSQPTTINKIPAAVRVDLMLSGELMKPSVKFGIVLKKSDINNSSVEDGLQNQGFDLLLPNGTKASRSVSNLEQNNSKKIDINSEAINLLITKNFSAQAGAGNQYDLNSIENNARQKASEIISSQLNNYAAGIIKGLDIDLGIDSKVNTIGGARNTNLKLGLSKKLANERLVLAVGKNFEIENSEYKSDQIFDNLQADWLITKDGRYRLNAFRKNQTNLLIEGTVVETGMGFVIALDYDSWKKLVNRNK